MKGKLVVLYGANNLGKTTQLDLLEKELRRFGILVERIKYPIYDLEPSGPRINAVLREGVEMDEEALQRLYAQNRMDFEPELQKMLDGGKWVIAEDYIGTGIAWGMVRGVSLGVLEEINRDLYPSDVSIMLYGKRFEEGREAGHRNETDDEIWQAASDKHDLLAERYGWEKVHANQSREDVHHDIMEVLVKKGIL